MGECSSHVPGTERDWGVSKLHKSRAHSAECIHKRLTIRQGVGPRLTVDFRALEGEALSAAIQYHLDGDRSAHDRSKKDTMSEAEARNVAGLEFLFRTSSLVEP